MIRAARHYERAGQILTRLAVSTARQYIDGTKCEPPPINQVITVVAPARIDLGGAWTDTPPQAFEFGGSVTTLALTVNGEVLGVCWKKAAGFILLSVAVSYSSQS